MPEVGASPVARHPRVIIVSGPSGAGKGTLIERILGRMPHVCVAVSATTRGMRPGEVDGEDYHFLTRDEFARRVDAGDFLEHVTYAGNRYGTLRSEVERQLAAGRSVVLEIELRGARAVRQRLPEAVSVFIEPPSLEELVRRLRNRNTEADADIAARLAESRVELQAMEEFDHKVLNDDVDAASAELARIVDGVTRAGAS
ncbi:MAG: guanylate kinase [Thermoleophilia bacterium]|nr:guanylate kinase [Thermoleophilia bacterium]